MIPFSFDWGKAYDSDEIGVILLKRQRAFLLKMVYNAITDRSSFLTNFTESDYDDIDEFLANMSYRLMNYDAPAKDNMNNRITLIPSAASVTSGNRMTIATGMYYAQNPPATGNSYEFFEGLKLSAGIWHTRYHLMRISSGAILRSEVTNLLTAASIDDDSYDTYNTTQVDTHVNLNSFTLTEETFIKLKVTANGKHASSSNFFLYNAGIELYRD